GFVADSRQYLYITSIEARAYNRPEAGAQVVMRLEEGDKLEVLETGDVGTINTQIDRWYRVQGPTTDGWVFGTQTSVAAPIMVDLAEDGALEVLVRSYDQQLDEYTSDFTEYTCEYKIVEGMDYKYLVVARECSEDVNPSFIYMSFYSFLREDQWSIDYEKLDLYQWWDFTCSEDGDEEYSLYCVNDGVITALVSVVDRVVENGELIGVSGYDIEFELSMNDMGELYFEILDGVEEGI
ncbi:MAG TPA: hypothetical protein DCR93_16065, partial [Cytophagales bacterium]|nr:hypothetical protein [Cytophagales bacterium]